MMRPLGIALIALVLAGCGEDDSTGEPPPVPGDGTGAAADTAAGAAGDTAGTRAADPPIAPVDTGPWVAERPAGALPVPDGWTAGVISGGSARGIAVLTGVRSARHPEYDRVVFEFDAHVPGYRIDYVDTPQHECGSGEAVRVAGDAWLQVSLEPANAHTEEGRPTVQRRMAEPGGANLRELRRICDFEAHVDWVIGVATPQPYRAFVLDGPPRLVVDVRN